MQCLTHSNNTMLRTRRRRRQRDHVAHFDDRHYDGRSCHSCCHRCCHRSIPFSHYSQHCTVMSLMLRYPLRGSQLGLRPLLHVLRPLALEGAFT